MKHVDNHCKNTQEANANNEQSRKRKLKDKDSMEIGENQKIREKDEKKLETRNIWSQLHTNFSKSERNPGNLTTLI